MTGKEMTPGEIERQLSAIWKRYEGIENAQKSVSSDVAEIKGMMVQLSTDVSKMIVHGTPRCAERGQILMDMGRRIEDATAKINGGVGTSRTCIQHHDLICNLKESHESLKIEFKAQKAAATQALKDLRIEVQGLKRWGFMVIGGGFVLLTLFTVLGPKIAPALYVDSGKAQMERIIDQQGKINRQTIEILKSLMDQHGDIKEKLEEEELLEYPVVPAVPDNDTNAEHYDG